MIDQEGIKIVSKVIDDTNRIKLIEVGGFVDQANCHLLQNTIDQCLNEQHYNLVFDLQNLAYMSSAGWGVLIGEIRRFRESNGDIKLINMGPEIYEVYQMLEFYHIISEYGSIEEALKSLDMGAAVEKFDVRKTRKQTEEEPAAPAAEVESEAASVPPIVDEPPETDPPTKEAILVKGASDKDALPQEEPQVEKTLQAEESNAEALEDHPLVEEETELSKEQIEPDPAVETSPDIANESPMEEPQEVDFLENTDVSNPAEMSEIFSETKQKEENVEKDDTEDFPEEDTGTFVEESPVDNFSENREAEAYAEDGLVQNSDIILEEEIDVNIDGILANEGISKSIQSIDPSGYIQFDPGKYNRNINIKVMPIPDKIRDIVGKYPELSPRQIQKMLTHPDYGSVKIGFFKLRSLLKALDLDTKEKRYRFYRSA